MITSLTNEKVKELVKLKTSKYRKESGKFIVEGPHLVNEAKEAGVLLETYAITNEFGGEIVTSDVMKKISSTDSPAKVIGVCKYVDKKELSDKILVLDDISYPTNLGTLLRSAKSFGFNTVVASMNTVDFYNDKVIRGSQGAIFKLNLISTDIITFLRRIKKTHKVYGTNVKNGRNACLQDFEDKLVLVLGNEAKGIKEEVFEYCDTNLFIQLDNMESLNVSVAGSILMYEIKKSF